jgi:hypothetical protein
VNKCITGVNKTTAVKVQWLTASAAAAIAVVPAAAAAIAAVAREASTCSIASS